MSVPVLFCWIRYKKLDLNNRNILDSIVIRSSINSRMLWNVRFTTKVAFSRNFASEPMTLRKIDHVSFFAEHALTFFAGESSSTPRWGRHLPPSAVLWWTWVLPDLFSYIFWLNFAISWIPRFFLVDKTEAVSYSCRCEVKNPDFFDVAGKIWQS